jgi:hypothetical protein
MPDITTIMAIDPGPVKSAWVIYTVPSKKVCRFGWSDNQFVADILDNYEDMVVNHLAIEHIGHYGTGMPAGRSVFDTCYWIGEFRRCWRPYPFTMLLRPTIKAHLCGSAKAKDGNVRQALIDRFPATGGGKTPQIGTTKKPGPLYGVSKHIWSALAVAVAWAEQQDKSK